MAVAGFPAVGRAVVAIDAALAAMVVVVVPPPRITLGMIGNVQEQLLPLLLDLDGDVPWMVVVQRRPRLEEHVP